MRLTLLIAGLVCITTFSWRAVRAQDAAPEPTAETETNANPPEMAAPEGSVTVPERVAEICANDVEARIRNRARHGTIPRHHVGARFIGGEGAGPRTERGRADATKILKASLS